MSHKHQTQDLVAEQKKHLLECYPGVKSAHLSEALAAGLGEKTHIGLLTHLDSYDTIPKLTLRHEAVQTRLWELGCEQHAPKSIQREYFYEVPCEDGAPGCYVTVERSVRGLPGLTYDQLLEIRDRGSVTLTADYVDSNEVKVTKAERKELDLDGFICRYVGFNIDSCTCDACGSDG